MPKLWLTRPEADSKALAEMLAEAGIDSLIAPVMSISQLPYSPPSAAPDAILITSRHAIPALEQELQQHPTSPVFCVGSATAAMARALGAKPIVGEGDMLSFLPLILRHRPSRLLYLSGQEISVNPATFLQPHGIAVERAIVYAATAIETLPEEAIHSISSGQTVGGCFFSARSAELANHLLEIHGLTEHTARMEAFCLSLTVAERAARLPWARVHACALPTGNAMRDAILSRYCPNQL